MTFYNPASLLSSPDAAVKPKPFETNTAAFAIGSAMESIRENLKKKKEVDDLSRDTEALAVYMDNRSPDLAALLREKTNNYNPTAFTGYDAIDVKGDKDKLLKGVIELYGKELDSNKLDASGNSIALQNNYGAKLRAAESQSNNLNNNWNTWEANETRREAEYEDNRRKLAASGKADGIPPFSRGANPYTAEKNAATSTYNSLLNANQSDIMGMSTPSKVSRSGNASLPVLPTGGAITPISNNSGQDSSMIGELPSGNNGSAEENKTFLDHTGPSVAFTDVEESQSTDPPRPANDTPMPQLSAKDRAAAMTGANEGVVGGEIVPPVASAPLSTDPIARMNDVSKQRMAGNVKTINLAFDQLIGGIKREIGTYVDKATGEQAMQAGELAKEEISLLPDPGSDEWTVQAKTIYTAYKASIATLQRNSPASEKKEQQVANQEKLEYYVKDSITKDPVTIYKRNEDGIPRYYILEQGKEVEVTNRIGVDYLPLTPSSSAPKVNVTIPGAKIKSLSDIFNK